VFRGREITHPQTGMSMLNKVTEALTEIATIEQNPNMEGRRMLMVIAPKPGVVRKALDAKKAALAAANQAALRKDPSRPPQPAPEPDDDDDLDEDDINADINEEEDDEPADVAAES
jgi:translation initiation factor IF-3